MIVAAQQPAPLPKGLHRFIVIAHRGDHTSVPENTIESILSAAKEGCDFAEIDLRTTRDGVLVIMHDETVDRMTDGKGAIHNLRYSELSRLKVIDKSHPERGSYSIPRFSDLLEACRGKIKIYLDFKDASVEQAYREISSRHMEDQIVVYINAPSQYSDWRRVAPQMPLMVSLPDTIHDGIGLKNFVTSYHPEVLDGSFDDYSPEMITAAGDLGIAVWPDIQGPTEGPELWKKAIDAGLKGLQSDHPAALISYLVNQGLR